MFKQVAIFVLSSMFLWNCKPTSLYEKEHAILDSTKIVLQVKSNELKKAEANIENTSFSKCNTYVQFLKTNLKDTVARIEANALQQFLNSCMTIEQFNQNKVELIKQTEMAISQLNKLSADLKTNSLPQNQVKIYFESEMQNANKVIAVIEQNLKALTISLINIKNSTPRTEEIIRNINNGQLPVVITDSIAE